MPSKNTPGQPDQPEGIDPAAAAAPTQQLPADAAPPTAPRNRFAWVSSPRVAAATVIGVLALGALGGAFALGRATAGHDHGQRGIMVEMGVPGGPGFDGRGFGRDHFGGQVPMPCQLCQTQPEGGQQDDQVSPAPSGSANG